MVSASYIAAAGATVCEQILNMSAYVIANKNTTGFKSLVVEAASMVAQNPTDTGSGSPSSNVGDLKAGNLTIGLGSKVIGQTRNMQQGTPRITNNTYDLMIEGKGFFVVTGLDGIKHYTRAGNFKKDATGRLVTTGGLVVSPAVTIPPTATAVSIGKDGIVTATVANVPTKIGVLDVATFSNESGLTEVGDNLYTQTDPTDNPVLGTAGTNGVGQIIQGALEDSNVQIVSELINVMGANTTFGFLMKIIEADRKNGDALAQAA